MNYANIKKYDIANGPGVRVSLFVSGCRHHCKECFNPETWDFRYGKPYTEETKKEILEACAPNYISGLSILGGEPFEPENTPNVLKLILEFKKQFPEKDIWCYTGYKLEELLRGELRTNHDLRIVNKDEAYIIKRTLETIDVLIDGEFHIEKKDLNLRFRGSSNQRVIDVPATLISKEIVLKKLSEICS